MPTVTVTCLDASGTLQTGGQELLAAPGPKWIDVEGADQATLDLLAKPFSLHRLAIEDCLNLDQRPKLEEYPAHLFVVVHGFTHTGTDVCDLTLHETHLFLAPELLISVHELPSHAVQAARRRVEAEPEANFKRGMDFVAYLIADALTDGNFPVLDAFNDELEELENAIFESPTRSHLERIFQLKRTLVTLRRVLSPQRDVVGLLSRQGVPHVQDRTTLYFRDVYDHLVRIYEQIDAGRDLVGNAMDGYLSMVANKTNEITKQLTLFATIFLPLSFITGFFGQNFEVLSSRGFLWVMLATVFLLPVGLVLWFRSREWV
jgi:magnesium transporter